MTCVSPHVLEQKSGARIPSALLNEFKFGLHTGRPESLETRGEFRTFGEESVDSAALKAADEAHGARLRELSIPGKRKRAANRLLLNLWIAREHSPGCPEKKSLVVGMNSPPLYVEISEDPKCGCPMKRRSDVS